MDSHHEHAPAASHRHARRDSDDTAPRRAATSGASDAARPGRRRATRPRRPGSSLRRVLPSAPVVAGVAALAVAVGGAADTADAGATGDGADTRVVRASALSGSSAGASVSSFDERRESVSRDSRRDALEQSTDERLLKQAEEQAEQRNAALAQFARKAEQQAKEIARNRWVLPLSDYRLSAGFGESSSLWAHTHTGLDFAAPSGTPIRAVAAGTVTEAGYDGSYGNKLVLTLRDGTELWFAHQSSFAASVGDEVAPGDLIGYVGSTGNSTGSHLHLEVRPGAGDPVDPRAALAVHGVTP